MNFFRTTDTTDTTDATLWKPGFTFFEMLMLMFIQYRSKLLVYLPSTTSTDRVYTEVGRRKAEAIERGGRLTAVICRIK